MRPSQSAVFNDTCRSGLCAILFLATRLKYQSYKDLAVTVLLLEEDGIEKRRCTFELTVLSSKGRLLHLTES
jgi:hypothetical protein